MQLRVTGFGQRAKLPFWAVNQPGSPGYRPGMQRHHILPRAALYQPFVQHLLDCVGRERMAIDDFRSNGLLLPAVEQAAQVLGLPLHRGPHARYNEVVLARLGQLEAGWQRHRLHDPERAAAELLMRMRLLQATLRRALLQRSPGCVQLNHSDPAWHTVDFSDLDAMADSLWTISEPPA